MLPLCPAKLWQKEIHYAKRDNVKSIQKDYRWFLLLIMELTFSETHHGIHSHLHHHWRWHYKMHMGCQSSQLSLTGHLCLNLPAIKLLKHSITERQGIRKSKRNRGFEPRTLFFLRRGKNNKAKPWLRVMSNLNFSFHFFQKGCSKPATMTYMKLISLCKNI